MASLLPAQTCTRFLLADENTEVCRSSVLTAAVLLIGVIESALLLNLISVHASVILLQKLFFLVQCGFLLLSKFRYCG